MCYNITDVADYQYDWSDEEDLGAKEATIAVKQKAHKAVKPKAKAVGKPRAKAIRQKKKK